MTNPVMNLISCPGCAVVYDEDVLSFPEVITHEDGSINSELAEWVSYHGFVPKINCRVCGATILQSPYYVK